MRSIKPKLYISLIMIDLLFVYGSLMDGENEFGLYLQQNSVFVNDGFAMGQLYDAGEYPGMVLNAEAYEVKGKIYQLHNVEKTLPVLDEYEGYGDNELKPNLFVRQLIDINTNGRLVKCWIYIYNHSVNHLKEITCGNYMAYKSRTT